MVATLLIWLYIFFISTVFGHLLIRAFASFAKPDLKINPSLIELSISGLVGLGVILSYSSIFWATGLVANLVILTLILIYVIKDRKILSSYFSTQIKEMKKFPAIIWILITIYSIMILFAAQEYPKVYDTGLYHAQFIQWTSSLKTVPGLGNLHGRFAFNNQSFLLEAFFSLSFLKLGTFHLLNSYLLLSLSISLIISMQKLLLSDWIRSLLYIGILILFQIFHLIFASSPTPDVFAAVGIWFIFITFFRRLSPDENNQIYWLLILTCTFFLVTVKLSVLPLIFISLIYMKGSGKDLLKKVMTLSISGLIVFIPFFVRNYIISGYLVYPYPSINIFNPDWKIPVSYVQEMKSVIASFAQSRDWQPRHFNEWLPIWFSNLSTIFKFLSVFILISPGLMALIILIRRSIWHRFKPEFMIFLITLIAIAFWFFSAPNFRFVYGFLFVYLLIITMIILYFLIYEMNFLGFMGKRFKDIMSRSFRRVVYTVLILLPLFYFINFDFNETKQSIVSPNDYKTVPVKTILVNNLNVNVPLENDQCWNTCIPCSFYKNNIGMTNIEMRGKELKDGFRVKK